MIIQKEIKHFHTFCGSGGGAVGFNRGQARVNNLKGKFRCLGGIDSDPSAIKDFNMLTGVQGTVLDLFSREQYEAWHGHEPPAEWREATPEDIRRAAGFERPNIGFTSPPCKGLSGLITEAKSSTTRYQALNGLTVRGTFLLLEAWKDDPMEFFILENVPRIANRGEHLLTQIELLLEAYGYEVARTTHDCGELGGLAQSRKRFLLVARHKEKVPPFLYEPVKKPLKGVGEIIGELPLPNTPGVNPMHQVPRLQWKTWLRLAFVNAGSDWRSLRDLRVKDGELEEYALIGGSYGRSGVLGVCSWDENVGVVAGRSSATNGKYSVADPRYAGKGEYGQYGVRSWNETVGAVSAQSAPGGGRYSVGDPRPFGKRGGAGKYKVTPWDTTANTVIGASTTGEGAFAVADPRGSLVEDARYFEIVARDAGVDEYSGISLPGNNMPKERENVLALIKSLDGTWHRPFTTLELAALQGLIDTDHDLVLTGQSHESWRERIGNMVPPPAAEAIAGVMGTTLLLAWSGETFTLGATPIWVKSLAIAASVEQPINAIR